MGRGLNTRIRLAVDARGMPIRIPVTEGTRADCSQAHTLIEGRDAEYLLADRAYDTGALAVQIHCLALWANIS